MCDWTGRLNHNTDICYSAALGGFYLEQYNEEHYSISLEIYPTGRDAMRAFSNNDVSWRACE